MGLVISSIALFQVLYFPARQAEQALHALAWKARSLSRLLAATVAPAFAASDAVAVRDVFRNAQGDPDLVFLSLVNAEGRPIVALEGAPSFIGRETAEFDPGASGVREESRDGRLVVFARVQGSGDLQQRPDGVLIAGFRTDAIDAEAGVTSSSEPEPQRAGGEGKRDGREGVRGCGGATPVAALVAGLHGERGVGRQPAAEAGAEQGEGVSRRVGPDEQAEHEGPGDVDGQRAPRCPVVEVVGDPEAERGAECRAGGDEQGRHSSPSSTAKSCCVGRDER
jgi:hypothetical protein